MKLTIKMSVILTYLALIGLLVLLLIYLNGWKINSLLKEGLNDEASSFIVTMTNNDSGSASSSDIFDNAKKENTQKITTSTNNGTPSHLEYNISSIKSDINETKSTSDIIVENMPVNVKLDGLKLSSNKKRTTEESNSFIMISPKTKDTFPLYFQVKLENNTHTTNMSIDLWGDHYMNTKKARPPGNPNSIIGPSNLSLYVPSMDNIPDFIYSKDVFSNECFVKSNTSTCMVGDVELGTRIANIIQTGDIFDINGTKIGHAEKTSTSNSSTNEDITITIENGKNITGLLLYMGSSVKL